jgi:hypothetical protein
MRKSEKHKKIYRLLRKLVLPKSILLSGTILLVLLSSLIPEELNAKNKAELTYNLKYGIIKGGEAKMIITDTIFNGNKAIHYYMEGRTTGITDKLFRVHNIYESIVDARTSLPYKAIRNVREGNYKYFNEVFFFHSNDSIYSQRTGGKKVPNKLTDILSVFFYFVKQDFINSVTKGKHLELPVINGHDISTIKIKHDGIQTINTNLGKVSAYILLPEIDKGKVLKSSDGLLFYISEKDKVPVLFDLDLRLGSLRAELTSYILNGKEIKSF